MRQLGILKGGGLVLKKVFSYVKNWETLTMEGVRSLYDYTKDGLKRDNQLNWDRYNINYHFDNSYFIPPKVG